MTKQLKKLVKGMAAALGLLLVVSSILPVCVYAVAPAYVPVDGNNKPFVTPDFIGVKVARLEQSIATKQVVSGVGLLYGICVSGTAAVAGKGSLAFDSNDVSGIVGGASVLGYAISPLVYALLATASATGGNSNVGCWIPRFPVQYLSGLIGLQTDAGHNTQYYYRPMTGVNP